MQPDDSRRPVRRHCRLQCGFDRLAPLYDLLGQLAFGGQLAKSQGLLLSQLRLAPRILIVGGGTGDFLVRLLAAGQAGEIDYVEISGGMLARARARLRRQRPQDLSRVHFHHCDIRDFAPAHDYDLICTMCVLDCFEPLSLQRLMGQLASWLAADGEWLCHDFQIDARSLGRRLTSGMIVRALYVFFGATCGLPVRRLPPLAEVFAEAGFKPAVQRTALAGLLVCRLHRRPAAGADLTGLS